MIDESQLIEHNSVGTILPPDILLELKSEVVEFLETFYGKSALSLMRLKLAMPPSHTTMRVNCLSPEGNDRLDVIKLLNEQFSDYIKQNGQSFQAHPVIPDCIFIRGTPTSTRPIASTPVLTENNSGSASTEGREHYPAVIVSKGCGEAVLRGANVFLKGVIGAANHIKKGDKVSIWVDVKGQTLRGEAVNTVKDSFVLIGYGITKVNRSVLISQTNGLAIEMSSTIHFTNPPMNNILTDRIYLQTVPSMLVGHVLAPLPGDIILDMCAAPGGKTSHLAALCYNKCKIIATEKKKTKLPLLNKNLKMLGVTCVSTYTYDALDLIKREGEKREPECPLDTSNSSKKNNKQKERSVYPDGPPFPPEYFDCIVLDPPCSGLGNRPRLMDDMNLVNLKGFSDYQKRLFEVAVTLLKPGGRMVYSTCTINPLENEEIVSWALRTFPNQLTLSAPPPYFQALSQAGLPTTSLSETDRQLVMRFDPTSPLDDIGFFIAKFFKTKASN